MSDNQPKHSQTTGSPHWHCTACHHEWDGRDEVCGWCEAPGEVIGRYHWPTMEKFRAIIDRATGKSA